MHSLETVLEGWERFVVTAGQSVVAMHRKAIDIARRNADNGFGLAESLAGAKNIAEAMELQTAYWRKQFGAFTAQAAEMRRIPNRMNTEGVTKSKRRLRP